MKMKMSRDDERDDARYMGRTLSRRENLDAQYETYARELYEQADVVADDPTLSVAEKKKYLGQIKDEMLRAQAIYEEQTGAIASEEVPYAPEQEADSAPGVDWYSEPTEECAYVSESAEESAEQGMD